LRRGIGEDEEEAPDQGIPASLDGPERENGVVQFPL
jgi:hypothetical protein